MKTVRRDVLKRMIVTGDTEPKGQQGWPERRNNMATEYWPAHEVYEFTQEGLRFRAQQLMMGVNFSRRWETVGVFASMQEASAAAGREGRVITELADDD